MSEFRPAPPSGAVVSRGTGLQASAPSARTLSAHHAMGEGGRELVLIEAGKQTLCIEVAQVAEVIKRPPIAPVPGTPAYHLGIASVRGVVTPVVALADLLGLADPFAARAAQTSRVLVLRTAAPLALAVSAVHGVVRLTQHRSRASIEEPSHDVLAWATHLVSLPEGMTPVLSLEELELRVRIAEADLP